ncbi:hypothetical protein ACN28S_21615 [Cystobacter fuscus]
MDGGDAHPDGGDGGPVIEPPSDAGTDGGTDAGTVAPKAYVRFVNAYLGLKNNPSDKADAPWEPYKVDLYVGDTKLFPVSVEPGDEAVTTYRELELAPGESVRFVVRNAESELSEAPVATSEIITLEEGERLTLVGTGNVLYAGADRMDRPRLLVLKESFEPVEAGTVRVRYVTADRVTGTSRNRRLANETGTTPYTTAVEPYSADTSTGGVSLPAELQRLAIIGTPNFTPSQSGKLFFSPPSGTLAAASAWFAITTGDDRRTLQDEVLRAAVGSLGEGRSRPPEAGSSSTSSTRSIRPRPTRMPLCSRSSRARESSPTTSGMGPRRPSAICRSPRPGDAADHGLGR